MQPRVYRRFPLRDSATVVTLHRAIQDACGWQDYHLFAFRTTMGGDGIDSAGIPDEESPAPDGAPFG